MHRWSRDVMALWRDRALSSLARRFAWFSARRAALRRALRPRPPHRRKVLFEMLEQRILLSGNPLASLNAGVMTTQLGDDSDDVVVTQVGSASDGGVIVDLTVGGLTERYGSADEGIFDIVADGAGGDDSFQFIDVTASVHLLGGEGSDTLFGPWADSSWLIDGQDSGVVANLDFIEIENLRGAADNLDTFIFTPDGAISGVVDGGSGGFDTLEVDATGFDTVTATASGPNSGTLSFDGRLLTYEGLEPVEITGVPNVEIHGTSGDDQLVIENDPGNVLNLRVREVAGAAESVSFAKASLVSLTVDALDGIDSITVTDPVVLGGGSLSLFAETIHVNANISGATDVDLIAEADGGALTPGILWDYGGPAAVAEVEVAGAISASGAVTVRAEVDKGFTLNAGTLTGDGIYSITSHSQATARVLDAASITADSLEVAARTFGDISFTATDVLVLSTVTIDVDNVTHAGIDEGAHVDVAGVTTGTGSPALLVDAQDQSQIVVDIAAVTLPALIADALPSFDFLLSTVTFNRDTLAYIGDDVSTSRDYDYLSNETQDLAGGERVRFVGGSGTGGIEGFIYEYTGGPALGVDLTAQNYATGPWQRVETVDSGGRVQVSAAASGGVDAQVTAAFIGVADTSPPARRRATWPRPRSRPTTFPATCARGFSTARSRQRPARATRVRTCPRPTIRS